MADNNSRTADLYWLIQGIALLVFAGLYLLYLVLSPEWYGNNPGPTRRYITELIPNISAGVLAFLVIYWFLHRRGLSPSQLESADFESKMLTAIERNVGVSKSMPSEVAAFYPTFKQVDWARWIGDAQLKIDIVVNYFDSWVKDNADHLQQFFRKPGTRMALYVPDPTDDALMRQVAKLYPDNSEQAVREKVAKTETRLRELLAAAGASDDRLEVYYLKHRPNYALQRLDSRWAVFSAYDHYRHPGVACPTLVIDLQKTAIAADYFEREIDKLREGAKRAPKPD